MVEKASCDEAYIDVTRQVEIKFKLAKEEFKYDELWFGSLFMGFKKGEGSFVAEDDEDKKLWIANQIAFQIRQAIKEELGYNASAGISVNKTVAKIACTYNKPNGQTIVPKRYLRQALKDVPIRNIRMLGGKLGKQLKEAGLETMGDI